MDSIIFDVDGTLWDSTGVSARAWTQIAREYVNPRMTVTPEQLKTLFGRLLSEIGAVIFHGESPDRQATLVDKCTDLEHQMLLAEGAPTYPRLEETLAALSRKFRLFIVSNCEAGYIEVFLQATGLTRYFEGHLCPGDTGYAKAENIRRIVKTYGLASPVYVGDTDGDRQASREAGVPFLFASYGFGQTDGADGVIRCPADLLSLCNDCAAFFTPQA